MIDPIRAKTMRERLGERASKLVNNDQYLPMVRNRQLGMTDEEFAKVVEIAEKAEKPTNYFMALLSKKNLERTLEHIRKLLKRSTEVMMYVSTKFAEKPMWFINYVADRVAESRYSMANVTRMMEISFKKNNPDKYLIGILKRGFSTDLVPKN